MPEPGTAVTEPAITDNPLLDEVEAAARVLSPATSSNSLRSREEVLAPVMQRWSGWPFY